jgi:hypothetical protein
MSIKTKTMEASKDETRVVFPDPGLHLAVLGALLDEGAVDPARIEVQR